MQDTEDSGEQEAYIKRKRDTEQATGSEGREEEAEGPS